MFRFGMIWKEQCLNGFYKLKFLKKADTNEVYLYEKHPSNLQGTVNHNSELDRAFVPTMC
jgi:hypothetical protein